MEFNKFKLLNFEISNCSFLVLSAPVSVINAPLQNACQDLPNQIRSAVGRSQKKFSKLLWRLFEAHSEQRICILNSNIFSEVLALGCILEGARELERSWHELPGVHATYRHAIASSLLTDRRSDHRRSKSRIVVLFGDVGNPFCRYVPQSCKKHFRLIVSNG